MILKQGLLGLSIILGIGLSATTVEAATKYVKVGNTEHNYLKTKQTIKTTGPTKKDQVTIPKGTIVEVKDDSHAADQKHGRVYVKLEMGRLSYHLRGNHPQYLSHRLAATTARFQKVRVPQYVQYYSTQKTYPDGSRRYRVADGNLYAGIKVPENLHTTKNLTAPRFYVTADGYLEYYKAAPVMDLNVAQTPTVSAKITKVKVVRSSGLRMLYTKTAIPAVISDRVSQTGDQQYLTTIKRRYRYSATVFYQRDRPTNVSSIQVAAQYLVKGHDFFMNTDEVMPD